jgi:hypothetical protein
MNYVSKIIVAATFFTTIAGCAGTNFKRPDSGALEVGKSTLTQVTQVMGAPAQSGEVLRNGEKLKSSRYAYAEGTGVGKYPGVVPARAMVFITHNEKLVAEEFVSSFPTDATDFDESKVSSIVKGKTTKAEVVTLLGKANGSGIYPFIKTQGETALLYSYGHAKGNAFNMKFYNKSLTVSFNAASVVTDVEFASNGEK